MPTLSPILAAPLGLLFLWLGAELLVAGASRLAARLGVSPLVIGLTLVAFGTSLPELLVSLLASWRGEPGVVIGNVVGSNIANIGLILGIAALIRPIRAKHAMTRREIPWMIGVALLPLAAMFTGVVERPIGIALLAIFGVYLVLMFRGERQAIEQETEPPRPWHPALSVGATLVGLAFLVIGAPLLLEGAMALARAAGVSELVIGLTLVAVGTSLPELATSAVAALRGQSDIALGNVVGSNVFNVLFILGLTSVVFPVPVPTVALRQDIPVMILFSVILLPAVRSGSRVSRLEGGVLLGLYAAYVGWLVVRG